MEKLNGNTHQGHTVSLGQSWAEGVRSLYMKTVRIERESAKDRPQFRYTILMYLKFYFKQLKGALISSFSN